MFALLNQCSPSWIGHSHCWISILLTGDVVFSHLTTGSWREHIAAAVLNKWNSMVDNQVVPSGWQLSGRHTNIQAHQLVDIYFVIYRDLPSSRHGLSPPSSRDRSLLGLSPSAAQPGLKALSRGAGLLLLGAFSIWQLLQLWCWSCTCAVTSSFGP